MRKHSKKYVEVSKNVEGNKLYTKEEATKLAAKYGMDKDEYTKAFGGIEMLKYDIKVQKVLDILKK